MKIIFTNSGIIHSPSTKVISILILIAFMIVIGISIYTSYSLTHPDSIAIKNIPQDINGNMKEVTFKSRNQDIKLSGWFLSAKNSNKTIIFAHGYKGNRTNNLKVGKALVNNGYNVLLFDFRNCGNSEGDITSIGQYETGDLLGAIDFIKNYNNKGKHIGLIGYSMGAATVSLAAASSPEIKAVVMDSSFADLEKYLNEKLPIWSDLPSIPFNWLILNLGTKIVGINPQKVSPIKAVQKINSPIFFIHGKADKKIDISDSEKMYQTSSNSLDQLWKVSTAGHTEASSVAFEEYVNKITKFFNKNFK